MVDSFFIVYKDFEYRQNPIFDRTVIRHGSQHLVRYLFTDLFQQGRDILEMIIEGIPVDPALVGNIPDSNFAQGAL